MKPGQDLDILVAEKVMGRSDLCKCKGNVPLVPSSIFQREPICARCNKLLPDHYSTDIAAAWQLIEKMPLLARMSILSPGATVSPGQYNGSEYMVRVYVDSAKSPITSFAATAPHAICLAALKAVG
jgi:hypothetical protein